jgi:hypothetical protein
MGRGIDGLPDSAWRDEFGTEVAKGELRFGEDELRMKIDAEGAITWKLVP